MNEQAITRADMNVCYFNNIDNDHYFNNIDSDHNLYLCVLTDLRYLLTDQLFGYGNHWTIPNQSTNLTLVTYCSSCDQSQSNSYIQYPTNSLVRPIQTEHKDL